MSDRNYFQGPPLHTITPKPMIVGPYSRPRGIVDLVMIAVALVYFGIAKLIGMTHGDGE